MTAAFPVELALLKRPALAPFWALTDTGYHPPRRIELEQDEKPKRATSNRTR